MEEVHLFPFKLIRFNSTIDSSETPHTFNPLLSPLDSTFQFCQILFISVATLVPLVSHGSKHTVTCLVCLSTLPILLKAARVISHKWNSHALTLLLHIFQGLPGALRIKSE